LLLKPHVAIRIRPRPFRLRLVTFDLTNTRPGDGRYRTADEALAFHGHVFRPIKQVRLVLTRAREEAIKASLQQRIGRGESVLVLPLTAIPSWRISRGKQREWRRFVEAVEARGLSIAGLSSSVES